jgi:ferredoxin-type protein NapF
MMEGKRLRRLAIRFTCLALASALLWPVLPWERAPRFVPQVSAFAAICSSIAIRSIGAGSGIGLLFAVIALFRRRWFCRYACPTGLMLEGAAKIGIKRTSWWSGLPQLGIYAALLTIAGAAVGYPVLLWMDPLSIFSSSFALRGATTLISGLLAGLGLSILVLMSLTSGGMWCARICPLGGVQELLASAKELWDRRFSSGSADPGSPPPVTTASLARRGFLFGAAGIWMGLLAERIGSARGENAPLRPPGAVEETRFTGLCIRCSNCVRACPSKIIHPDTGRAGMAGLLAPEIRYEKKYCLEDCRVCTQVCPSGALKEMNLAEKRQYIIGEALVDGALCLLALGQKDCDACLRACPFEAVRIQWDEEQYLAYPVVITEKCNGCGACEVVCPAQDIKAIRVWKRLD